MSKWDICSLKDAAVVLTDGDWIESKDQSDEGIRLIQTGNIGEGKYVDKFERAKFISPDTFERLGCTEVFEGDVLVSRLPSPVGRACIVPSSTRRMITAVDCSIIRFNRKKCLNRYFVYYSMSGSYQQQLTKSIAGSTRVRISRKNLQKVVIPLPPLETQRKIAKTLDTVSEMLAMRKQQLVELDNLIKSIFYDMFGDPVKNKKGWEFSRLEEITCKVGSGATPRGGKQSYQDNGVSLVRSMNVHNGTFKYNELAHIDDEQAKLLDNVIIEENDVLINITGASVARSCIVPKDVMPARVNQHVSIIRAKLERVMPEFLNALLIFPSYQDFLLSLARAGGATREAITKQQLLDLRLIVPPLSMQQRFAEVYKSIEEQKIQLHQSVQETYYLSDSLMSRYFD